MELAGFVLSLVTLAALAALLRSPPRGSYCRSCWVPIEAGRLCPDCAVEKEGEKTVPTPRASARGKAGSR